MPHHKSCKKRLKTSEKANTANRAVRSSIRTSLKIIRTTEDVETARKELPRLESMLDKAAKNHRAGFTPNRASNYKRKVASHIRKLEALAAD